MRLIQPARVFKAVVLASLALTVLAACRPAILGRPASKMSSGTYSGYDELNEIRRRQLKGSTPSEKRTRVMKQVKSACGRHMTVLKPGRPDPANVSGNPKACLVLAMEANTCEDYVVQHTRACGLGEMGSCACLASPRDPQVTDVYGVQFKCTSKKRTPCLKELGEISVELKSKAYSAGQLVSSGNGTPKSDREIALNIARAVKERQSISSKPAARSLYFDLARAEQNGRLRDQTRTTCTSPFCRCQFQGDPQACLTAASYAPHLSGVQYWLRRGARDNPIEQEYSSETLRNTPWLYHAVEKNRNAKYRPTNLREALEFAQCRPDKPETPTCKSKEIGAYWRHLGDSLRSGSSYRYFDYFIDFAPGKDEPIQYRLAFLYRRELCALPDPPWGSTACDNPPLEGTRNGWTEAIMYECAFGTEAEASWCNRAEDIRAKWNGARERTRAERQADLERFETRLRDEKARQEADNRRARAEQKARFRQQQADSARYHQGWMANEKSRMHREAQQNQAFNQKMIRMTEEAKRREEQKREAERAAARDRAAREEQRYADQQAAAERQRRDELERRQRQEAERRERDEADENRRAEAENNESKEDRSGTDGSTESGNTPPSKDTAPPPESDGARAKKEAIRAFCEYAKPRFVGVAAPQEWHKLKHLILALERLVKALDANGGKHSAETKRLATGAQGEAQALESSVARLIEEQRAKINNWPFPSTPVQLAFSKEQRERAHHWGLSETHRLSASFRSAWTHSSAEAIRNDIAGIEKLAIGIEQLQQRGWTGIEENDCRSAYQP